MKTNNRTGIAVAGSILVDKINEISAYPNCGELTKIQSISVAVGGCVPNVAIDLKKISPEVEISALGKIGDDQEGKFVIEVLNNNGVNTDGVLTQENQKTTFTDVMSVSGGQRTFFTYLGADSDFSASDIDYENSTPEILHLGYFLLLDKVDNGEGLKILKKAKEMGIKTSIDLVSENSDRYSLIIPCLPYVDYLIINESEAGKLTSIEPKYENLKAIAQKLKSMGVSEKVIIHMPDGSVCYSNDGFSKLGSYSLPDGYIKGTTGAGDAFCAGALMAIYENKTDLEIMELASSCAVMALGSADATSGLASKEEIKEYCKKFGRRNFEV